ncbi:MAG: DNA gyrase subunit A [Candidatus Shapirobacteria bacterium]|nr:DNA gyrase subunit A [Candidatus Shapirobacteria bacterium]MDD3002290.1 DNA gyrase subunit A [Candidatus Shapirobacteria bacterium]MDD4382705.1 DNA gyrase subunit A [Candidatus Shapirobacteria bacterium]
MAATIQDPNRTNPIGKILEVDIVPEMETSYLDYAMSVIVSRALPDVRDGLKPVHRRIIYDMDKMGLGSGGKTCKSAKVVGDVLGKYHPHGDMSVYGALVRLAQDFSMRYTLVKGQGNFGSIDGDPPAAMRYTEVKMDKISTEIVADMNKETVDMVDNFDATEKEPSVLPTKIPTLLLNGADGIAVGMATRIPPHNLKELCQAIDFVLDHSRLEKIEAKEELNNLLAPPKNTQEMVLRPAFELAKEHFNFETNANVEDLVKFVQGPDFPTAGEIYGKTGIIEMYNTGRGKFIVRGKTNIEETKSGKVRIVITELPYQVNKAELVKKIADLVRDKKIIGISDLRDESDRHGIRVVIEIKKIGRPKSVLNKLFKYTALQSSYSANMLALVDNVPQTLNLRQMLLLFLRHRENVVRRRTIFDLKGDLMRAHILEGLKKALDVIDEVIKTIRGTKPDEDPKAKLMEKFGFTDLQAQAILEMQLKKLSGLERQKLDDEYNEIEKTIAYLTSIITKPEVMVGVLKQENNEIMEKYGDVRRTKIYARGLEEFSEEDLIPNEAVLVALTKTGYIKRVTKETYHTQKRGGVGVVGMTTKNEDEIECMLSVDTHDDLLFFTNRGRVFKTKVWDVQEGTRQAKGQAVVNLINTIQGETVQTILPIGKNTKAKFILLATKNGVVKKTSIDKFKNIRQTGLAAIKLDTNDQLIWAKLTEGDNQIFLVTKNGKCIRFDEKDCRPMGRQTRGVRGILLKEGDTLVGMDVVPSGLDKKDKSTFRHLLVVTENGVGKRTDVYLYPSQKRGGIGIKVANLSVKSGKIAAAQVVSEIDELVVLVSKKAITIKLPLKNIPTLSRNTKGVILMRFKSTDDKLSAMTIIDKNDSAVEDEKIK